MHTVTFYSFKGGVGRSLALANVAYELARSGERVLLVDFDLEAPGLDTLFDSPGTRTPGLVEYITDYLQQETPPDVLDYVQEVGQLSESAPIYLMPAGAQDDSYARRLNSIDWAELYERYDGYLMFEDLKAQWAKKLDVSYVLIDSRTGHTDVGGICTRQLPDTVVAVFFPNQQNLRGLSEIVEAIRAEPTATGRDEIDVIFVASDLPRLDDEDEILSRTMRAFRRRLKIEDEIQLVHHYDSLDLIERPVFTRARPNTRLAREYVQLARRIRMKNVEDRDGVLWLLRQKPDLVDTSPESYFQRLSRIEAAHSADGEILFELGRVRSRFGQIMEATALLEEARATFARPKVWLALAENYQRQGQKHDAARSAEAVFQDSSADQGILQRAIEILRLTEPERLKVIGHSPAVRGLDLKDQIELAVLLDRSHIERQAASTILTPLVRRARRTKLGRDLVSAASLTYLALGKFGEARELLIQRVADAPQEVPSRFNLAMAEWADRGAIDPRLFAEMLEIADAAGPRSPNYWQCMAVAHRAVGRPDEALHFLEVSRAASHQRSAPEFSCWRYLRVSPSEFRRDLDHIADWIQGGSVVPDFFDSPTQLELGAPQPEAG